MDKKSKYRISLGDGGETLHEELTPVEFFQRIIALRRRYNPTFSVFDEETGDWSCFQSTELEPPIRTPKGKPQNVKTYTAGRRDLRNRKPATDEL